jgi:pilus assembly protein Flp/PilA
MIKVVIQKVAKSLTRLPSDERATALMEYSLLLGMVVVAVISIILFAGQWVSAQWQALSSGLSQTPNQP